MHRFSNNIHDRPSKGPSAPVPGNPNSHRTVFSGQSRERKRRKTEETSSSRQPGPSTLPNQGLSDRQIDLTKDDVELVSHSSTVADDSEDSLNLGAEERSKIRIADDGPSTRRLKADRRGGESSKAVNPDVQTEPIEEYPSQLKVKSMVQRIEQHGGKPQKLALGWQNPLDHVSPTNRKQKVRLFIEKEGGRLIPGLSDNI